MMLLACVSAMGQIQHIKIVSFTVKNQLPASIDNWSNIPGALLLVAQKAPPVRLEGVRLVLQIKANGAIYCGTNVSTGLPVENFTTRTFQAGELISMLGGCHDLKEGNYMLCAQFFNIDKVAISDEVCKPFMVESPKEIEYNPPTLITPESEKVFTSGDMQKPVMFRWTPLVPKPRDPVTYRLRVWQLMQGQTATQALRTNQPIVTKDVDNITQAVVTNIYTGPCRPPYLCDFVWNVQAVNKERKPMGRNNGTSEPWTFKVKEEEVVYAIRNQAPEDKKQFAPEQVKAPITFRWTPLVPKPSEPVTYRLKVWQLMQGQSGSQAMRTNQPIVTKDVADITEATVNNIYTGPCRPPYLCDYIWIVEATIQSAAGTAPRIIATSGATVFSVNGNEVTASLNNFYPEDKKQFFPEQAKTPITFRWTPLVPKSSEPVTYRLKVWQLMQGQTGSQAMKSNQPIATKDLDNLTEATISTIYTGPCRPPYLCDYIWNVEAMSRGNAGTPPKSIATSIATTFSVRGNETEGSLSNVFPEDKKQMAPEQAKAPITFRWTPLVPKPQGPVTYRMKVWQLMQGQTGSQAMKTNQPIVTREVHNITEATVTNIYTGPCRPPYLCDYIWIVEATMNNAAGTPPRVIATSEATTFSVTGNEMQATLTNVFPEDKKAFTPDEMKTPVNFRWTPLTPKPSAPVTYRLKVWQLMQGQTGSQAMKANQPIFTKDLDNITETTGSTIYTGPCRPPYLCDYIWIVEATLKNADGTPPRVVATSEPTQFSVKENEVKGTIKNVLPEDKKQFTPDEMKAPVTFRWTPLTPKPSEPLTYRLKVWQLMQGQNGSQAMKSNQPIVTKDVDNLTETTVSNIYTGPCRPPYLCDYIWNVEVLTRNAAGTVPKVIASSEPTMFAVTQYIIQLDSIRVECTSKPGVYSFSYTITNPNVGPATLNLFTVTSSVPAGATISTFAPPINTIIAPGNQLTITGTINAAVNLSNICIGAEIKDVGNAFWKASKDTCYKVGPCKCDACDSVKIDVVQKDIKFDANGNIVLNTNITISPKLVKSVKAELVYYEYKPESDDCMLCNKDSKTFGNFDSGNLGNTNGTGAGTHSLAWNFNPSKNLSGGTGASMVITVPPTVKCCDALIRWCIRYVVTFDDCTVCNKLICYEKKKEGCAKGNPNPNNDQK